MKNKPNLSKNSNEEAQTHTHTHTHTQRLLFTVMVNEQTVSGKISIDRSMMAALLSTIP